MWYQSEFPNTRLEDWLNSLTKQENKNIDYVLKLHLYININLHFARNGRSRSIGRRWIHHNILYNIYVELNNQPSKVIQTIKDLRAELQTIKEDNERILRV